MNIVREMSGKCQGILKKPVAMNPVIDIDFGGGDADSVVLIAWHPAIDKSYVLALALLLYQESDI